MASYDISPIAQIPLSNVSVGQFGISQLYCLSQSSAYNPLQDPRLYPECYGLCPNPAVSGIGTRTAVYAQALVALWVVVFCYKITDVRTALFTNSLQPLALVISSFFSYEERALDLHHAIILLNLSSLPTVAFAFALVRLKFREDVVPIGIPTFGMFGLLVQVIGIVTFGVVANHSFDVSAYAESSTRWCLAQPACFSDTVIVLFGLSFRLYPSQASGRTLGISLFALLHSLPFILGLVMYILFLTRTGRRHQEALREGKHPVFGDMNVSSLEWVYTVVTTALGTAYIVLGIIDTELQIRVNTVLSGESAWTQGQVTAVTLVFIPLCNLFMIGYRSVRKDEEGRARPVLDRVFGIEQRHPGDGGVTYEPVRPQIA